MLHASVVGNAHACWVKLIYCIMPHVLLVFVILAYIVTCIGFLKLSYFLPTVLSAVAKL